MRSSMTVIGSGGVLWALLVLVSPAVGFECAFTPPVPELVKWPTPPTEVELGQWAVADLKRRYPVVTKGEMVQQILEIANRLRPVVRKRADEPYTVEVLDTPALGACVYPGGYVVLTKGLIKWAANDDERAMVIAHEFVHIAMAHMDKPIETTTVQQVEQWLSTKGPIGQSFINELRSRGCNNPMTAGVRKDKELEADKRAIVAVFLAGYNPVQAVAILDKVGTDAAPACQPSRKERKAQMAAPVQEIIAQLDKFDAGVRFYVQQEYERAIKAFHVFLAVYPGPEIHHNLATAYHRLALSAQPPDRQLKAKCSLAFEAQTRAGDFRTRDPNAPASQERFQWALQEAIGHYQQARTQDPEYAPVRVNLACAYLEQGKYSTAQDLLQEAIQADPKHAVAYNNLGVTFLLQGHRDNAGVQWQKAAALDPHYADPQCNLVRLWKATGHPDQAQMAWRRYLELVGPGPNPCAQQARSTLGPPKADAPPGQAREAERAAAPIPPGVSPTPLGKPEREIPLSPGCAGHDQQPCPPAKVVVSRHPGLTVLVEGQVITQVVMTSPTTHTTAKGIRIGHKEEQVRMSYGAPARLEEMPTGRYLVYDDLKLAFAIREGKVASWFLFQ